MLNTCPYKYILFPKLTLRESQLNPIDMHWEASNWMIDQFANLTVLKQL